MRLRHIHGTIAIAVALGTATTATPAGAFPFDDVVGVGSVESRAFEQITRVDRFRTPINVTARVSPIQTQITLEASYVTQVQESSGCFAGGAFRACSVIADAYLKVGASQDFVRVSCSSGNCTPIGSIYGRSSAGTLALTTTIQHNLPGNPSSIPFQLCSLAVVHRDQDGDGQWSDDPPVAGSLTQLCSSGTVTLTYTV